MRIVRAASDCSREDYHAVYGIHASEGYPFHHFTLPIIILDLFDFLDKQTDSHDSDSRKAVAELAESPEPAVEPLSVSALTFQIKSLIEDGFADVLVVGEISNLSRPRSGHLYFTLKDEEAQLPAVAWKSTVGRTKFEPRDGMELLCRGRINVFPPHGKYQLVVDYFEPLGVGALELAFRQLRERLAKEGLFAPERKRPLPAPIRRVALITSPSGAAIRDFLQVLGRRTQRIDLLIVPVKVQGDGAATEIAGAIKTVNRLFGESVEKSPQNDFAGISADYRAADYRATDHRAADKRIDLIVLARGGGSVEDLWTFNEEILVRAVAGSRIPVVSAVGHEVDVSLCDLAADIRALTPSEAAERIAVEDAELAKTLLQLARRLEDRLQRRLDTAATRLAMADKQRVFLKPERLVDDRLHALDMLENRLESHIDRHVGAADRSLATVAASLEALSPLAVLKRGFSITLDADRKRICSVDDVGEGHLLRTRLADGEITSRMLSRIVLGAIPEIDLRMKNQTGNNQGGDL